MYIDVGPVLRREMYSDNGKYRDHTQQVKIWYIRAFCSHIQTSSVSPVSDCAELSGAAS